MRIKAPFSTYEKIQKGGYGELREIEDLVAARAIFLHPSHVRQAVELVNDSFPVVSSKNDEVAKPYEFQYRQPHLVLTLPEEYLKRHRSLHWVRCEVQFTTYIQHALQESVHDVIYKGHRFSWQAHRLDGRLRGLLEIVDSVLENMENVVEIEEEPGYELFDKRNEIIEQCREIWSSDDLPTDLRRFAITIEQLLRIADAAPGDLLEFASRNQDIVQAIPLNAIDKVIGILLRERSVQMRNRIKDRKILVSTELESFLSREHMLPDGNRFKTSS